MNRISILVITGNQRRHHYFANTLSKSFDVAGILSETAYQPPLDGLPEDIDVLTRHFIERENAEERYFENSAEFDLPGTNRLSLNKGESNSEWVAAWIEIRNPDFIILYGSGIIQEPLLEKYEGRILNMHLGLSPYYRGSGTNFWPLVNNQPELVGTTIHLASRVIDGGAILGQVRPAPASNDRCHDLGCKSIIDGTYLMMQCIRMYSEKRLLPVLQTAKGNLYRRSDFSAQAVRRMWLNFENAMMDEYIRTISARQSAFPILD